MKINHKTIKILKNYVLVKPDANYETIQSKGTETGIILPDFVYEQDKMGGQRKVNVKERNFSVYGTVYAIPQKIGFHKRKIKQLNSTYTVAAKVNDQIEVVNRSVMSEIGRLTEGSCLFETECEVKVGDRVKFSYLAHKSASEKKIAIDTEEGEMYLVKYDLLTMVVDKDAIPIKMLNGYILVEPEEDETIKTEGAMSYRTSDTGLMLPTFKHKQKRNRKTQKGKVLLSGNFIGGYLQDEGLSDPAVTFETGESVMYDPRGAARHEHHYHQEYSDKPLQLIQRRDLYLSGEQLFNVEIKKK